MPGETDEAGGLMPANEENEVRCDFSPEKPCLLLPIEGENGERSTYYGNLLLLFA